MSNVAKLGRPHVRIALFEAMNEAFLPVRV